MMPNRHGRKLIGYLTSLVHRTERDLARIDKAERENRGHRLAWDIRRRQRLDDMADLLFLLDTLRYAYAKRVKVLGHESGVIRARSS